MSTHIINVANNCIKLGWFCMVGVWSLKKENPVINRCLLDAQ